MSHRVALCGEFPTEVEQTPIDHRTSPGFGRVSHKVKQSDFAGVSLDLRGSKIKQVKESGSVNRPASAHSGRQSRPHKGFCPF